MLTVDAFESRCKVSIISQVCIMQVSALEVLRKCAIQIYYLLTYLLMQALSCCGSATQEQPDEIQCVLGHAAMQ